MDLMICETILGVLKSRDTTGRQQIHGGDFKKAIDDLGLPWGSPVIDQIMLHCRRENDGIVNFAPLADYLAEERMRRASLNNNGNKPSTSTGVKAQPFRADLAARQTLQMERQSNLLEQFRAQVQDIYRQFSAHEISVSDMINELGYIGIEPTQAFTNLLKKDSFNIGLGAFLTSLKTPDNAPLASKGSSTVAGQAVTYERLSNDDDYALFNSRLRKIPNKTNENSDQPSRTAALTSLLGLPETYQPSVAVQMASASGHLAPPGAYDRKVNLKSSEQVRSTLFSDKSAKAALFSASQGAMIAGINPATQSDDIRLRSEQHLVREQVLALMRRFAAREISRGEFQTRVTALSISLPESVATELRRAEESGFLDIRKAARLLDEEVFKEVALDRILNASDIATEAESSKLKLLKCLCKNGASGLLGLECAFHEIDTDSSGSLSFHEFLTACRSRGLSTQIVSDNALRNLFAYIDADGDGELQRDEFMSALRGELNSARRKIVQLAFSKLDARGRGQISIADIARNMNPSYHPDVIAGTITPERVLSDLISFLEAKSGNGMVTEDMLISYYAALSPVELSDDAFITSVKQTWALGDKAPAPPVIVPHTTFGVSETKDGAQVIFRNQAFPTKISNGDVLTWSQEPSQFENIGQPKGRLWRSAPEGTLNAHNSTKVASAFDWNNQSPNDYSNAALEDYRTQGGNSIRVQPNKQASTLKIEWRPPSPPKPNRMPTAVPGEQIKTVVGYEPQNFAGKSSTVPPAVPNSKETYGIQGKRMSTAGVNQHWGGAPPFGKDESQPDPFKVTSDKPRSLAEVIKKSSSVPASQPKDAWGAILQSSNQPAPKQVSLAAHLNRAR